MLVIGLLIGGMVVCAMLVDEGEVVTLCTRGSDGDRYDTQLWVIEDGGELYLRAHFARARWLARIRRHPEVELHRGDASQAFLAGPVEDPEVRRSVNRKMAEKYGFADRLASWVWNPEKSIPVHLRHKYASARHP
jgi:hypothetical protein